LVRFVRVILAVLSPFAAEMTLAIVTSLRGMVSSAVRSAHFTSFVVNWSSF
jgi:hypothetical protein